MINVKEMLSGKYLVFDSETTMNCPISGLESSPHWPKNHRVMWGFKTDQHQYIATFSGGVHREGPNPIKTIADYKYLVGHNIKFDLLYSIKVPHNTFLESFKMGMKIWDTQVAEYILTGQQTKFSSLDELSEKYGGTKKNAAVTAMFESGKGADAIPEKELLPYLKDDLSNTEIVFLRQVEEAAKKNMLPLILAIMDSVLMTTMMEHHGIKINESFLKHYDESIQNHIDLADKVLSAKLIMFDPSLDNYNSPAQLSKLFFGGEVEVKERVISGKTKNGDVKYKTIHKARPVKSFNLTPAMFGSTRSKSTHYSVDEDVLNSIVNNPAINGEAANFASQILDVRKLKKIKSTYIDKLKECTIGGFVHPNFHHASTVTGRSSCSNPNLQNQKDGDIKRSYTSRWEGGKLIEFDYGQLEIVALAHITKDKQLIEDINTGKDIHTELFVDMFKRFPMPEERKSFKPLTFGLIYGSSATGLAKQSEKSLKICKDFINAFYTRYPDVHKWHQETAAAALLLRTTSEFKSERGVPLGIATFKSETGREYVFKEYEMHYIPGKTSFSPTELKNYFVQGFATGDIVPIMMGVLFREWIKWEFKGYILPVCTVHDSILFDVHPDYVDKAMELIPKTLVKVQQALKNIFNIEFNVRVKIGTKFGPNWYDMEEVESTYSKEAE